jgi:hypothetical protein
MTTLPKAAHLAFLLLGLLLLSWVVRVLRPVAERFTSRLVCPTRNMSYDLRGDVPIPRSSTAFRESEIGPLDPAACASPMLLWS